MKLFTCGRRTLWIGLLYVALVHALLCVAIWKTNFLPLARKTLGLDPPEERNIAHYQTMLGWFERDRRVPAGAVVLLGDSLLQDLDSTHLGREVHSFALGGTTASVLLEAAPGLSCLERAKIAVLGVGANDLKYRSPTQIRADYSLLLNALPPELDVVVVPVLPVDERAPNVVARPYLSNRRLGELDQLLSACALARPRTRRVDVRELLAPDGSLRSDLHSGDGWHLSDEGDVLLGRAIARELDLVSR
ncbi:MAG: SGNH/GDSL hydrolase family protein [Planctomycetes bacterium]|nr:SGNH/GDSL hydrolase family protein [Planctomycetota bacterium]